MKSFPLVHAVAAYALFPVLSVQAALDFEKDVRPLLAASCFKCHSGSSAKKQFQMDKPEEIVKKIGPDGYIVPGNPEKSEVMHRITLPEGDPDRMPPPNRGVKALDEDQVAVIRQWIAEGAVVVPGQAMGAAATAAAGPDPKALHVWKGASGSSFSAYFVKMEGTSLVLRSEAGQEKAFPAELFSAESLELAKRLGGAGAP
jgi:hypothetical protein